LEHLFYSLYSGLVIFRLKKVRQRLNLQINVLHNNLLKLVSPARRKQSNRTLSLLCANSRHTPLRLRLPSVGQFFYRQSSFLDLLPFPSPQL